MLQSDIYNQQIIDFAARVAHMGTLERADARARAVSRLCGSQLEIELRFDTAEGGALVADFAYKIEACILGQAAAAIVAENIIGSTKEELRALIVSLRAMLRTDAPPPEGRFAHLKILESARAYKTRHGSILLITDTLQTCLDQLEAHNG